jgi:hypothetical protein
VIAVKDFELSFWDESLVFFDFLFASFSRRHQHRPDSRKSRSDSAESEGLHRARGPLRRVTAELFSQLFFSSKTNFLITSARLAFRSEIIHLKRPRGPLGSRGSDSMLSHNQIDFF